MDIYNKNILSRLKKLDEISKKYKKHRCYLIMQDLDNKYYIDDFKGNKYIYDDRDKFILDMNIDTSDKNTHIVDIKVCKNRTINDIE